MDPSTFLYRMKVFREEGANLRRLRLLVASMRRHKHGETSRVVRRGSAADKVKHSLEMSA